MAEVIRAINVQITRDFEPYWHMGGRLRLDSAEPGIDAGKLSGLRGDAILYVVDRARSQHLGSHQRHANGVPFGFVHVELAGDDWAAALSHEALELLADPHCNLHCKGPHPDPTERGREVFHWMEVCDPVQADHYEIDGVRVSNFVLPLYFTGGEEMDGRNDFLGSAGLRSFGVMPGGYVGFYDPITQRDQQWFADPKAETRFERKQVAEAFRRATRRSRLQPLRITPRDLHPGLPDRIEAVEGIYLRLAKVDGIDRATAALQAVFGSTEKFVITRSTHERRDLAVTGPALARPLGELWDIVRALEAEGADWLEDADVQLIDRVGHEDAEPGVRASGKAGITCHCDEKAYLPESNAHDWALVRTRIPAAWRVLSRSRGNEAPGKGILIAHPDTGYTEALERAGRIAAGGFDFIRNHADGRDPLPEVGRPGHGTRTGSVLVGPSEASPNKFSGVAPGARLVPYRIAASPVLGSGWNLAEALHAAIERGVDVVSMSVGTGIDGRRLARAIEAAWRADLILVAAAGNCVDGMKPGGGFVVHPARNARVIACAAIDARGQLWCGTSNGEEVDVYAPGDAVWCHTVDRDGHAGLVRRRGTSFATALVAGTAALWIHHHGRETLRARCRAKGVTLTDLFRAVLDATGKPTAFSSGRAYAKVLDAEAVLEHDLDDAGVRPRQQPSQGTRALGRLAGLVPGTTQEQFEQRLAEAFRVARADLPALADEHEREFAVALVGDDRLRSAIADGPSSDSTRASGRSPAGTWSAFVSSRLRARQ